MKDPLEKSRLDALRNYNILDTLTEKDYDDITFLASIICVVPISLISFVDEDRQWFKSHPGLDVSETKREYSFCAHALQSPEQILIVPDSRLDSRFKTNPLVTGAPGIVFYAGVPMVNEDGQGLGTVCIIDTKPRNLTEKQLESLKILAAQVMNLLEMRKKNRELYSLKTEIEKRLHALEQFSMVVSHDIRSPLSTILLANQMLQSEHQQQLGSDGLQLVNMSTKSAEKIHHFVNDILSYHKSGLLTMQFSSFQIADLFNELKQVISSEKKHLLFFEYEPSNIFTSRTQVEQILLNLINNGIRYNDKEMAEIRVSFREDPMYYHFTVSDNGMGISEDDIPKVFKLFSTISENDQLGKKSLGVGLPTVLKLVELLGGKITLNSEFKKGSCFHFTIKK